jgi:GNAT superfamily N-acetyltransferase
MSLPMSAPDAPSLLLRQFEAEMRADPPPEPGVSRTWSGGVLRATGLHDCVEYSALGGTDIDAAIATQIAVGAPFEWKLYGHDRPGDLADRLARAGFKPEESEHFMVLDLTAMPLEDPMSDGIAVRQVRDMAGLEAFAAVNALAFDRDAAWIFKAFSGRLADPTCALHIAYDGAVPVATGRLELPPGRAFASIWSGCTMPSHRGRGIYRALVATRAWEALWRGYRYLTVDARDTSRPILARMGFVAVTTITDWTWKP